MLNGITFIWNEEKAWSNTSKHDNVTFQQAAEVFFDPFLIVVDASRNDEARDAIICMDRRSNLLYVRVWSNLVGSRGKLDCGQLAG